MTFPPTWTTNSNRSGRMIDHPEATPGLAPRSRRTDTMNYSYSIIQFMPDRVSRNAAAVGVMVISEQDGKVAMAVVTESTAYLDAVAGLFMADPLHLRQALGGTVNSAMMVADDGDLEAVDHWIATRANDIHVTDRRWCSDDGYPRLDELRIPGIVPTPGKR